MARWVDGREPGSGYWTNTTLSSCELCGVDLGPGDAVLRRCRGCDLDEHRVPDQRGTPRGGVHARCRDEGACRRRQTPRPPSRRELAASVRASVATPPACAATSLNDHLAELEARMRAAELLHSIVDLIERDGSLTLAQRAGTAQLVRQCTARRDGLLVELEAVAFVVAALTASPRWAAVRAAAAACVAHDWEEYQRVELVLSEAGTARRVA